MGSNTSNTNNSPDESSLAIRYYYHALARALENGSSTRPPLPIELVRIIMRLARCILPSTIHTVCQPKMISVHSSGREEARLWFKTLPLTSMNLARMAAMRLSTESKHQGWVSDPKAGCWSWFSLVILPGTATTDSDAEDSDDDESEDESDDEDPVYPLVRPKNTTDGRALSWKSHYNRIDGGDFEQRSGGVFGPSHELWTHVEVGDSIGVVACAQFPAWECQGKSATLEFWDFFEPTLPPRQLAASSSTHPNVSRLS